MAQLPFTEPFDAETVEPAQPFEVLPAGRYIVEISDSEMKDNNAGTGQFLALTLDVIDDEYAGRKLFVNLNLINPNPKAEEIARRELSAICHAVDVLKVNDSTDLHNRPFAVEVKIEKRKDNGEDANRVKAYMAAGPDAPQAFGRPQAQPQTPGQRATVAQKAAAPAAKAPAKAPWAKTPA